MDNLGYLFYKDYYGEEDVLDGSRNYDSLNEGLLKQKIRDVDMNIKIKPSFSLITRYPGCLVGIGNMHESGQGNNDEIKIGFYFDYTTGLPNIPGSTIKGILRSAFEHKNYIADMFEIDENDVDTLKKEIFDGKFGDKKIPAYERDIFFDAVINIKENLGKTILADDYITPHLKNSMKELGEPTPIRMLKIPGDIVFDFYFALKSSRQLPVLTAEKKTEKFKEILLDFGVGAKTNVGYGNFSEDIKKIRESYKNYDNQLKESKKTANKDTGKHNSK